MTKPAPADGPNTAYYNDRGHSIQKGMAVFAGVAIFVTAAAVGLLLLHPDFKPSARTALAALAGLWGIGTPLWFFYEYFWLYPRHGVPGTLAFFTHRQHVAVGIWAAVTATLYGLSTSDMAKPEPPTIECKLVLPAAAPSSITLADLTLQCPNPGKGRAPPAPAPSEKGPALREELTPGRGPEGRVGG